MKKVVAKLGHDDKKVRLEQQTKVNELKPFEKTESFFIASVLCYIKQEELKGTSASPKFCAINKLIRYFNLSRVGFKLTPNLTS